MPNVIAYLMLLVWPVLAWTLFSRLKVQQALIWSILGAYMLLPPLAKFDLPAVPDFDKFSIANLCALGFTLFLLREKVPVLPDNRLARGLMGLFVLSPFVTSLTNPDPIPIYTGDVPALRLYDSVAFVSNQVIALIPFFLARRFLGTAEGMRALVQAMALAGLIYSVPMLFESRFSPQLNTWIYGFFQHDFSQSMRGGGFRPMVFMPHGLWVAFFALMAALSALVLLREAPADERPKRLLIWLYLMGVLVMCRSAGPMVYTLALIPVILLAPRRVQLMLAGGLAVIVITYPFLRGAHLIPLDRILDIALSYSAERHQSLEYRIVNEEQLLARAQEKFWFGWGGYGRNLILDPYDGHILTIPDGGWIIVLGKWGWTGYVAQFGMLVLPLLLLGREAVLTRGAAFSRWGCTVALIYAANLVDLLPNDTLIPFTWLMAGALLAWAEALATERRAAARRAWEAGLPQGRRTVV